MLHPQGVSNSYDKYISKSVWGRAYALLFLSNGNKKKQVLLLTAPSISTFFFHFFFILPNILRSHEEF